MAEHTTQQPIRVVLVDDHALVRQGFRRILEDDEDITVIGEAGNGLEGLALVKKLEPDVVVMDMAMPEMNGLHASIEMLKQRPGKPHPDPQHVLRRTVREERAGCGGEGLHPEERDRDRPDPRRPRRRGRASSTSAPSCRAC